MTTPTLPDNLKSRVSRIHVAEKTFQNEQKENIAYSRLVLEFAVNGSPINLEFKIDKKDLTLLSLADVLDQENFNQDRE